MSDWKMRKMVEFLGYAKPDLFPGVNKPMTEEYIPELWEWAEYY